MVAKFVKTEVCGLTYSEGSKEKGQKTNILYFILYCLFILGTKMQK